ncbi:hypothetical protein [Sphingomonas sp. LH128]|jgi:hypothetical protein
MKVSKATVSERTENINRPAIFSPQFMMDDAEEALGYWVDLAAAG